MMSLYSCLVDVVVVDGRVKHCVEVVQEFDNLDGRARSRDGRETDNI